MRERIIADVFVFACFLWAPWRLTAAFAVIFMILFENYWEGRRSPLWRILFTLCLAVLGRPDSAFSLYYPYLFYTSHPSLKIKLGF